MDQNKFLSNVDPAALDAIYQQYQQDPAAVDPEWARFFDGFDLARARYPVLPGAEGGDGARVRQEFKVLHMISGYRTRGHFFTHTNPVRDRRRYVPDLALANFGLSEADLDTVFEAGNEIGIGPAKLRDIRDCLEDTYCKSIGVEYRYIRQPEKVKWLQERVESGRNTPSFTLAEKKEFLFKLNQAVVFEKFLGTKFIGQKRFSIEGVEALIPALDWIIEHGSRAHGVKDVVIGMAHRGRLNVLANTLNKTYASIFTEFEGKDYEDALVEGDVKYHMGYNSRVRTERGEEVTLTLSPNPSHLESVGPVVQGIARAILERHHGFDHTKVVPVIIHGDAAIAGQGVVYELVQMAQLKAYSTGGSVHIVTNNQVGFTTNYTDGRSSIYCTDVAKVTACPIFHVNADDVEAVAHAVQVALDYRQKFGTDVFIDLLGYRRHGHNEGDEPKFTQPRLYKAIAEHPDPREIYKEKLLASGSIEAGLAKEMEEQFKDMLEARLNEAKQTPKSRITPFLAHRWEGFERPDISAFDKSPETGVPKKTLQRIGAKLSEVPAGKKFFRKLERILKDRARMMDEEKLDWGMAELLAYGSIALDGKPMRLTGQDVERGTFSHRHAVVTLEDSEERYMHLAHLGAGQGTVEVYNSLLSEYAVMGFEYGYAFYEPHALQIWEAQFGDFVNGAQIILDQYLCAAEEKWNAMNGLVLLLPHGYEGQGAEHSSARMERFLATAADGNMQLVNCTTPANFFHVLRRQLAPERNFRRPLVVFTPKSLLRHPRCVSPLDDLVKGRFQEVIDDAQADPDAVTTVILCQGKIYYELLEKQQQLEAADVAIVRVEQLHPLPDKQLAAVLKKYAHATRHLWVQEEPANMGAWAYMHMTFTEHPELAAFRLQRISRKARGAPATGSSVRFAMQQNYIIEKAFSDRIPISTGKTAKAKARA
ncbi:MAG: 2-oxoglutarate dehydrogenase E1 component [Flavobacteriales bacterium]|jgi:2-oxoglutarate dehydrogenase E1 component|nr:2-oxoglutarate dehydrogenase E1 component [Flavobacteriales bacterium]